jgi:hypothetical protein
LQGRHLACQFRGFQPLFSACPVTRGEPLRLNPNQPPQAKKQTKCKPKPTKKGNHPLIQVVKQWRSGLKPLPRLPRSMWFKLEATRVPENFNLL